MRRRDGTPLWINDAASETHLLRRVDLQSRGTGERYDEDWLQQLLQKNPMLLPVEQIEPGFGHLIPLCRELPLTFGAGRSGALDNLFVTADGGLLLVEAKLWRNPEARRTVVAQAMEYAAAVFRLTYEEFENAVQRARLGSSASSETIYNIVRREVEGVDEAEFVDAVSRNLKRGRAIIAVVGDGIREDLAPLAELLQTHAGHRFIFALVELAVYETPQVGIRVVTPSILAQTALIERGVIQIEEGGDSQRRIVVREPAPISANSARDRSFGIGEDEFYEVLEKREPGTAGLLKSFLTKAQELGVYADRQSGLNLKHASPIGNPLNLGTVSKDGFVDTGPATWWGRTAYGRRYNEMLAAAIGGFVRDMKNGQESAVRTASSKTPRLSDFLPKHEETWLRSIEQYVREIFDAAKDS